MAVFVLVPGSCHGGWWYQPVVDALAERGHQAVALTLAGLGEEGLPTDRVVTLDSHVDETVAAVTAAAQHAPQGVVLVGHSYAGSVITGAADHIPKCVRALAYLDAFVPADGDCCYSMTSDEHRRWYLEGAGRTGLAVDPLPFFDPRARPHPLATLLQRSKLTGAWQTVPIKHYVAATDATAGPHFLATAEKLRADPAWAVHYWPTRHNVLHDGPQRVVELLTSL